jgi:DNA-binding GntR family transcriptional regulator
MELHRAILHACRNRMLRRAMEEQEALRVIAVLPPWRVLGRMQQTFREHIAVLRAILKSDRAAAAAALRKHLTRARDNVVAVRRMLSLLMERKELLSCPY